MRDPEAPTRRHLVDEALHVAPVTRPRGPGAGCCCVAATMWRSMSCVTRSASRSWPCRNSQRGLSGTLRRTSRIAKPDRAGEPDGEPPADVGRREQRLVEQQKRGQRAEDRADPVEPQITKSTASRTRAGINSSTAEWMAQYSPPTPTR